MPMHSLISVSYEKIQNTWRINYDTPSTAPTATCIHLIRIKRRFAREYQRAAREYQRAARE